MMRFDFELALLDGSLAAKELPEAWGERIFGDLGVRPEDHNTGVLQDVHWFVDFVGGAFQGYTLGNVISAQLFQAARRAHPGIEAEIARGEFSTLRAWLTDNVYRHGRKYPAADVVERATGAPIGIDPYLTYLEDKYRRLYRL